MITPYFEASYLWVPYDVLVQAGGDPDSQGRYKKKSHKVMDLEYICKHI
jgi:hypothetical protein